MIVAQKLDYKESIMDSYNSIIIVFPMILSLISSPQSKMECKTAIKLLQILFVSLSSQPSNCFFFFQRYKTSILNADRRFGLQLGSLSGGRISVSFHANSAAMLGLTIGIRYACVRKQFGLPK